MVGIDKYIPQRKDLEDIIKHALPQEDYSDDTEIIDLYYGSINEFGDSFESHIGRKYKKYFNRLAGAAYINEKSNFKFDPKIDDLVQQQFKNKYIDFYLASLAYALTGAGIFDRNGNINQYALSRNQNLKTLYLLFTRIYRKFVSNGEEIDESEIANQIRKYMGEYQGLRTAFINKLIDEYSKQTGMPKKYVPKGSITEIADYLLSTYSGSVVSWFARAINHMATSFAESDRGDDFELKYAISIITGMIKYKNDIVYRMVEDAIVNKYNQTYADLLNEMKSKQQTSQGQQQSPGTTTATNPTGTT
ncbi:hypothetical protein YN1_1650 [Nanoarchaeota archaeon]